MKLVNKETLKLLKESGYNPLKSATEGDMMHPNSVKQVTSIHTLASQESAKIWLMNQGLFLKIDFYAEDHPKFYFELYSIKDLDNPKIHRSKLYLDYCEAFESGIIYSLKYLNK